MNFYPGAETRAKISAALCGQVLTEEHKARIGLALKGKTLSPGHRAKISLSLKGKVLSPEHKARISLGSKGKVLSPEHRAKISAIQKSKKLSPEHKEALLAANTGKIRSAETRDKISAALRGRSLSPEHRAACSVACKVRGIVPPSRKGIPPVNKGVPMPAEQRAKMRASQNKRWADPNYREHMRVTHTGNKHTDATKLKIATTMANFMASHPYPRTSLEAALARYLTELGVEFVEQKTFGRCVVDAYVPATNTIYEADGSFWHTDSERAATRDAYLCSRGVGIVVHLSEAALAPWR